MTTPRVAVAMSGGVDSTASALLLRKFGPVHGFLMNIGQPGFAEQAERLQRIAAVLGIGLEICDLRSQFDARVRRYFLDSYAAGTTPNPCMRCNREIKFGLFMDHVLAAGFDRMATGHYARVERTEDGCGLFTGTDRNKDQSYFLARLTRTQLARVSFPLGTMTKEKAYELVEAQCGEGFRERESQDICFLAHTSVTAYLSEHLGGTGAEGPIVTTDGTEIGRHAGLFRYTVGQRRGLGLPDHSPWYVCALDGPANRLIVGKKEALSRDMLTADEANWLVAERPRRGERLRVKIRSTHGGCEAEVEAAEADRFALRFTVPEKGVAPGQYAVLYAGDRVVGSGRITVPPAPAGGP